MRTALLRVAVKWRGIGLELGLADSELETIHANNRDDIQSCLSEMLRDWLNRTYNTTKYGEPSWQKLSDAVCRRAGGNNPSLANEILHYENESRL